MADVEHRNLTGASLHEPKGVAEATEGHVYVADGGSSGDWTLPCELIGILEDQKSSGTNGGSFSSGADRTRTLNTEVYDKHNTITLASNQFTITPNGTQKFIIEWSAPAYGVAEHQTILRQTSGVAADIKRGTSENSAGNTGNAPPDSHDHSFEYQTRSHGMAVVTISAATTYEIRHRSQNGNSDGFGVAGGFGTEVYTQVKIYRTG